MALIKCSECGKEISDKAGACPSCGNPVRNQLVAVDKNEEVIEIIQTSKRWKRKYLWGLAFMFGGLFVFAKSAVLAFLLIFTGGFIIVIASIGAWWTNG